MSEQIVARTELRAVVRTYLAKPAAERRPDVAEQALLALLDYFDGEEAQEARAAPESVRALDGLAL